MQIYVLGYLRNEGFDVEALSIAKQKVDGFMRSYQTGVSECNLRGSIRRPDHMTEL